MINKVRLFFRRKMQPFMKKTPSNYIVVHTEEKRDLEVKIRNMLSDGWEVSGSVSISYGYTLGYIGNHKQNCIHFGQAMIKI